MTEVFDTLNIMQDGAVFRITIDNPPQNSVSFKLLAELGHIPIKGIPNFGVT